MPPLVRTPKSEADVMSGAEPDGLGLRESDIFSADGDEIASGTDAGFETEAAPPGDFDAAEAEEDSPVLEGAGPPPLAGRAMPARYTPEAAAAREARNAPPPAAPVIPMELWPETLPSREEALSILTGHDAPPRMLAAATQTLLAALSEIEFESLTDASPHPEVGVLRQAVIARWRMSAGLALKPSDLAKVSSTGLDALLEEADAAIGSLRVTEEMEPTLRAGFEAAKTALISDAVELAGVGQAITQQAAVAAIQVTKKKYKHVEARITTIESVDTKKVQRESNRTRTLTIAVSVIALITVVFHGLRLLEAPPPSSIVYIAEGVVGRVLPDRPVTVVVKPDLSPISDKMYRDIELVANARGLALARMGPTQLWMAQPEFLPRPQDPKK